MITAKSRKEAMSQSLAVEKQWRRNGDMHTEEGIRV
jgi:hypothetical protein